MNNTSLFFVLFLLFLLSCSFLVLFHAEWAAKNSWLLYPGFVVQAALVTGSLEQLFSGTLIAPFGSKWGQHPKLQTTNPNHQLAGSSSSIGHRRHSLAFLVPRRWREKHSQCLREAHTHHFARHFCKAERGASTITAFH